MNRTNWSREALTKRLNEIEEKQAATKEAYDHGQEPYAILAARYGQLCAEWQDIEDELERRAAARNTTPGATPEE